MRSCLQKGLLFFGLLSATTAYAQFFDLKDEIPTPCPRPCPLTDGIYVGTQLGYNNYRISDTYAVSLDGVTFLSGNPVLATRGWVGGVFVGYGRYVTPLIYLGAELFANYSGAKSKFLSVSEDNQYHAKVRGDSNYGISLIPGIRLNPTTRLYARVGYNSGHFRTQATYDSFILVASERTTSSGAKGAWQAGLGVESLITEGWSLRAEYNYSRFSDFKTEFVNGYNEYAAASSQFMFGVVYHYC